MKNINFQKEKGEWDLDKIIRGKTSSYTKDNDFPNIQRNINKYKLKSPRYKNIILNNIFSIEENDNNDLNKNINIFKNNSNKSKDNNNEIKILIFLKIIQTNQKTIIMIIKYFPQMFLILLNINHIEIFLCIV